MNTKENFSKEKYELKWGEKYSTLIVDMFARVAISHPDIMSNDISDYLTYIKDSNTVKAYYGKKVLAQMEDKHGKYFLKKSRIKKLIRDYNRVISQYKKLIFDYKKYNLTKLSNQELSDLFEKYVEFTEYAFAYFRLTREEAETGPTEKIISVLKKYYPSDKIDEIFQIISQSPEIDMIGQERIAWFQILKKDWNEKRVHKYIMDFAANFVNMYEIHRIKNYLKKRYQKDRKHLAEIKKEIENNKIQKIKINLKQKEIYKYCRYNKDLIDFSEMLQKFGPYRFKLKYCWAGIELHLIDFFEEIRRRLDITFSDFFDLYLVEDVIKFFKTGEKLTKRELRERKKCIIIHVKNKKYKTYFGNEALYIVNKIEKQTKQRQMELQGMVAFSGYVRGRVKIVHSTDIEKMSKIAESFQEGEILVSENTQPAMIVLMKKSAAVLTEQGGRTSHASIVSREFRKPCIVGIRDLLKNLKNGDLVEVDANKGIVRILK